jgi:hypothetical protein
VIVDVCVPPPQPVSPSVPPRHEAENDECMSLSLLITKRTEEGEAGERVCFADLRDTTRGHFEE